MGDPIMSPSVVALLEGREDGEPLGFSVLRAILADDREGLDAGDFSEESLQVEACLFLIEILHQSSTKTK